MTKSKHYIVPSDGTMPILIYFRKILNDMKAEISGKYSEIVDFHNSCHWTIGEAIWDMVKKVEYFETQKIFNIPFVIVSAQKINPYTIILYYDTEPVEQVPSITLSCGDQIISKNDLYMSDKYGKSFKSFVVKDAKLKEVNNMDKNNLGFICSLEIAVKFPKLNKFCITHDIDGKIINIEYIGDDTFVTFRFDKDRYYSAVRRYRINDKFALQRVESILISDLLYDLKVKKTNNMKIKNVIFQDPATIVFWEDGTKTVVRAEGEDYDPEKGLAMAISRKALGNNRDYYNTFIHWLKRYKKEVIYGSEKYKEVLKKLKDMYKDGLLKEE